MSEVFIHNKGVTKTLIRSNNRNDVKEIGWDAEYDGERANISLDFSEKGDHDHYQIQLSNDDLEKLFSIPTVNRPIHERLQEDFLGRPQTLRRHRKRRTHISSLRSNQQYIVPVTRRRRHKKHRRSSSLATR